MSAGRSSSPGAGCSASTSTATTSTAASEGLYYSRRIGRTPQLAGTYGDTVSAAADDDLRRGQAARPVRERVLARRARCDHAARSRRGATRRSSRRRTTPWSARRQELRNGNTSFGAIVTAVNRTQDRGRRRISRRTRTSARSTFAIASRQHVRGLRDRSTRAASRGAARRSSALQTDAVHYYQRPDAGLPLDSIAPCSAATPRNSSSTRSAAST